MTDRVTPAEQNDHLVMSYHGEIGNRELLNGKPKVTDGSTFIVSKS